MDMLKCDVISELLESTQETKEHYDAEPNDLDYGKLLAYCQMIAAFRTTYISDELVQQMLAFDEDERFLYGTK